MANITLNLVPQDRFFVPTPEQSARARQIIARSIPEASSRTVIDELFCGDVSYFETGLELEDTECPVCGDMLAEEIEWWGRAMRRCSRDHFRNLSVVTPCCKRFVDLDQLPETGAFASYGLSVRNPPRGFPGAALQSQLETVLGAPLRAVVSSDGG